MLKKLTFGALTTASLILQPVLAELVLLMVKSPTQSVVDTLIGFVAALLAGAIVAAIAGWRGGRAEVQDQSDEDCAPSPGSDG